jgi:acyl-homoserine-lactone acylase
MFITTKNQLNYSLNWRQTSRRFLPFLLGIIFTLVMSIPSFSTIPTATEILWDTYGIPHIYGNNPRNAFKAFGWAQMQSHGNLLLRLYGQSRGKAAEYWGEKYLDSDKWVLTMDVPKRANAWYKKQDSEFRSYLDAFAEGINNYAKKHPDLIDDQVKVVLPVTANDILAHVQRVLLYTFIVNPNKIADINDTTSPPGSNGWAIAPKRSADKKAMLLANPHLPWGDLFLWYEAQITAPGIDAYGATLVGVPVLAIAFNDNLGWTHTVNTHDGWDAYELKLQKDGYVFDHKIRPFQTNSFFLKVKQENGSFREHLLTVKNSIHGPVVKEKNGQAIALRVVGQDSSGVLKQWWDMAKSQNLSEFERVLQRLQLPMFTIMYADREGHIMHLFNGLVPVRKKGDFKYWQGIIPGDKSNTLWTKFHPYQDLPKVIDPPSGWLQNANDAPWTTTFPTVIKADDYPAYIAPRGPMYFRAQSSARLLAEDEQISFEEMITYKHSTRMEFAERILDDLIPIAQKGNKLAKQAAQVLTKWDRQANANSKGAVLFKAWTDELDFDTAFSQPWNENQPRTTPDGLANSKQAVKLLEKVAQEIQNTYGSLDISWGEVYRLRVGNLDLPANGGEEYLGTFRVVDFAPAKEKFQAVAGDSFVAAVEFSQPVRAMALNSYGNATQPHSAHIDDQLKLFAEKKLRPVWRNKEEIHQHLEARKIF